MSDKTTPTEVGSNAGLGPLVVNGVTFEPLRLPVPQIAPGLPGEVHVFSHEMLLAAVTAERERCAELCDLEAKAAWALWATEADPIDQGRTLAAEELAARIRGA